MCFYSKSKDIFTKTYSNQNGFYRIQHQNMAFYNEQKPMKEIGIFYIKALKLNFGLGQCPLSQTNCKISP